ncbi:MAG: cupin domain-containing protein [Clostridia bacterium]|nr:cupin domain-containing protein [Clostridia bacterium]MBR6891447.1 cupin domain-containing protein [Clostridia bacterium]
MNANIVYHSEAALRDLGGGVSRRVLAHTEQLMVVEVHFEEGGVGSVHTHPHCQNTYVLSGKFRFTIDGEPVEVGPGDTLAFPSGVPHGTVCLEKGVLLDMFAPMREDFL